jgi:hypothetical protein
MCLKESERREAIKAIETLKSGNKLTEEQIRILVELKMPEDKIRSMCFLKSE